MLLRTGRKALKLLPGASNRLSAPTAVQTELRGMLPGSSSLTILGTQRELSTLSSSSRSRGCLLKTGRIGNLFETEGVEGVTAAAAACMEAEAAAAASGGPAHGMLQPPPQPGDIHGDPTSPGGIPGMRVDPQQTPGHVGNARPFGGAGHVVMPPTVGWQATNAPPGGQMGVPGVPGGGPLHPTL